ncbi:cysteine proteinase [Hypoxylon trugodes]|uniref:cysteine proteinase n=1 Tax=Hypoxylon trugodes TaxID=326681 RepID=UPI00219322B1|nr:cysteine proteinase [Hypoxylon trugodes]KAI1387376.1 cysteine proteinase [Hypoxylon trugodes]
MVTSAMSSVAFTTTSPSAGIGPQGTMASVANGNYRATADGGSKYVANGSSGSGSGSGRMPFRHINDLVSVEVYLDPHTPLRKMLEVGDTHMRQATTFRDFKRPDLALQEYIKAFTIAVDKIPRHKDYPSMKTDRGDLNRLYNALKMKITTNGAAFDQIKEDIKEDNKRSGVQPTVASQPPDDATTLTRPGSSSRAQAPVRTNGSTDLGNAGLGKEHDRLVKENAGQSANNNAGAVFKSKPPVHPKPQALHGNAITQTSKASPEDLTDRFARLRDTRKAGNSVLAMPKLPEAIYSPARGTVTSEVANLPSSTPRGMFSRTNSTASSPTVSARIPTDFPIRTLSKERFVTAHSYEATQSPITQTNVRIPEGDTITASALVNLTKQGSPSIEILVIDVRDRESFDAGHISSTRTICIEPEILMRENISADEIVDSMVLAPPNEIAALEQRDRVDLIVIYNEDSTSIPTRITGNPSEMVLRNLWQALSYYNYNKPLKGSLKLLSGGLSSWVYEYGYQSLETSSTVSDIYPQSKSSARRYRSKTKTLSRDEINHFEDIIKKDQTGASDFDYAKTREDFIRRFPSITGAPESMTSPVVPYEGDYFDGISPAPPRRPAPAIPRVRYSGLDSRDDSSIGGVAMAASATPLVLLTGLINPGTACYCNTTIQALLASPGFVEDFVDPAFPENWRASEVKEPTRPQLLAKIMKNLFLWMRRRQFKVMRPETLMHYLRAIHEGYVNGNQRMRLGDGNQHDVDELTLFIFGQLASETNIAITKIMVAQPDAPAGPHREVVQETIHRSWQLFTGDDGASFIDKHFGYTQVDVRHCTKCQTRVVLSSHDRTLYLTPKPPRATIFGAFRDEIFNTEEIEVNCDKQGCGGTRGVVQRRLARHPPLLRVYIRRTPFTFNVENRFKKSSTPVDFPLEFDPAEFALDVGQREAAASVLQHHSSANEGFTYDDGLRGKPKYVLYAVQVHQGKSLDGGHYWAWVRDKENTTKWIRVEDDKVNSYAASAWDRTHQDLQNCPRDVTPMQLWYKRDDIKWEYPVQPIHELLPEKK